MPTSATIFSSANCSLDCNSASLPLSWRILPSALRRWSGTDRVTVASSSNSDLSRFELVGSPTSWPNRIPASTSGIVSFRACRSATLSCSRTTLSSTSSGRLARATLRSRSKSKSSSEGTGGKAIQGDVGWQQDWASRFIPEKQR